MPPRFSQKFPWYVALSSVAVLAAAIRLGYPIPRGAGPQSSYGFLSDGPQLFAYLLLAGIAAFMCAQSRLERRSILGYESERAFVLWFMGAFAFLCAFAGSALYGYLRDFTGYVVYAWGSGDYDDAWDRAQAVAAIVRALSPIVLVLMIGAAFFFCAVVFKREEVRGTGDAARRFRAIGMFTGVVVVVSLLVEASAPGFTPSRFVRAYGFYWQPVYGTLSVLFWTALPTFIIARCVAPRDVPNSRPGRILVFGVATVAAIQLLRIAAMEIGWEPFIVAVFDAGYFPALADFQENHPLATVAIVYVIQLPLALISIWCGARFALKCSRFDDQHEAIVKT
ncbi:hypothetical protein [Achromobacter sp.]|uniref:hypothetical protein n=1 Tax=Achromobacter sp. TaxID=134375 RepID=UPI0028A1CCB7|nr:hypothetical protein [Achromobacter sp.]